MLRLGSQRYFQPFDVTEGFSAALGQFGAKQGVFKQSLIKCASTGGRKCQALTFPERITSESL